MTSARSLGQTRIVLQFGINTARSDPPADPTYREVKAADAPILILTSGLRWAAFKYRPCIILFKAHKKCYQCSGLTAHLFDGK